MKEIVSLKNRTCGFISQHFWELSHDGDQKSELGGYSKDQLKAAFLPLIVESGVRHFAVSMERGLPVDAVEAILELRKDHPITLECVIPFEEQHVAWPEDVRERYFHLLGDCNKEHMIQTSFSLVCYQRSIKYLLSCCEQFIIVWSGRPSDAEDAIQLARRKKRQVSILDPAELQAPHPD